MMNTLGPLAKANALKRYTVAALPKIADFDATRGVNARGAVNLVRASSQYLTKSSPVGIGLGTSNNLVFGGWVNASALPSNAEHLIFAQYANLSNQRSWNISLNNAGGSTTFRAAFSADGSALTQLTSTAFTPADNTWYFLMGAYDRINNLVRFRVATTASAPAAETASHAGGLLETTAPLTIGYILFNGNVAGNFDGRIDQVFVGNPSAIDATSFDNLFTLLWNSGAGTSYGALSSTNKTDLGLVSWYELNESSGTRNDSHGSNHMTPGNSPTAADGIVEGSALDLESVSSWVDTFRLEQSTISLRPTYRTAGYIDMDGTDDRIQSASLPVDGRSQFTHFVKFSADALASIGNERVIHVEERVDESRQYRIALNSAGKLVIKFRASGDTLSTLTSAATLSISTLYTVAIVRDGTVLRLYVNGNFDSETTIGSGTSFSGSAFRVGNGVNTTSTQAFDGKMYRDLMASAALNSRAVRQIGAQL